MTQPIHQTPIHQTKKRVAGGKDKMSAPGEPPVKLLVAMTGRASAAKTASGDRTRVHIHPEPPVTPIGMGKSTRGVELASAGDFDESQLASWMKQAVTMPFVGAMKR